MVADELIRFSGQDLVAPQTVLEEDYWDELLLGLANRGHDVLHVLLEAEEDAIRARIEADQVEAAARPWRIDHLSKYADARAWMTKRADLVVDTTRMTPQQVAERIWDAAQDRTS